MEESLSHLAEDQSLDEALTLLNNLARISAKGNFIFRGEARAGNKHITSSLYRYLERRYPDARFDLVDISLVQSEMLGAAKRFSLETDEHEILATLRHNGGVVNLVDFTADYNVALFFASDGSPVDNLEDGRVIIMNRSALDTFIPKVPERRVAVQKSIFVSPSDGRGVISHSDIECILKIPAYLKPVILRYLHKSHDIRSETIYNDLIGFIALQDRFTSPFAELIAGSHDELHGDFDAALARFDKLVGLPIYDLLARFDRGKLYVQMARYPEAVDDFNIVIEAGTAWPDGPLAVSYLERASAFLHMGDLETALQDLKHVKELICGGLEHFTTTADVRLAMVCLAKSDWGQARMLFQSALEGGYVEGFGFREEFGSVSDFSLKYGVMIPDDLVDMLESSIDEDDLD